MMTTGQRLAAVYETLVVHGRLSQPRIQTLAGLQHRPGWECEELVNRGMIVKLRATGVSPDATYMTVRQAKEQGLA